MDKLSSLWCWLQDTAPGLKCCQNAAFPPLSPAPGWRDSHLKWIWMARENRTRAFRDKQNICQEWLSSYNLWCNGIRCKLIELLSHQSYLAWHPLRPTVIWYPAVCIPGALAKSLALCFQGTPDLPENTPGTYCFLKTKVITTKQQSRRSQNTTPWWLTKTPDTWFIELFCRNRLPLQCHPHSQQQPLTWVGAMPLPFQSEC